ncbi:hypothetical protein BGLA2_1760004 [Burkholderia gladioli]|nr:hypothetical protein BGLA2_1760004 [Burkholderia gladioli]
MPATPRAMPRGALPKARRRCNKSMTNAHHTWRRDRWLTALKTMHANGNRYGSGSRC